MDINDAATTDNGTKTGINPEETGQIKEALGRLYREVADLKISQKLEHEEDRKELKAWAQTNLTQTQLLARQTEVIDQLTQEIQRRETYLRQQKENNHALLEALTDWKNLWESTATPDVTPELRHLSNKTQALQTLVEAVLSKLDTPRASSQRNPEGRGWNAKRPQEYLPRAGASLAVLLLFLGSLQLFPPPAPDQVTRALQAITTRSNWTNAKLSRLEKKLGSAPGR